jgi:hypothetical protein
MKIWTDGKQNVSQIDRQTQRQTGMEIRTDGKNVSHIDRQTNRQIWLEIWTDGKQVDT